MPRPPRRIRNLIISLLEHTLTVLRGRTVEHTPGPTAPDIDRPHRSSPAAPSAILIETDRARQLRNAVGLLFAALDEINNPELLVRARELRDELSQEEPDLKHIIELRRYFAALPNRPRSAAAIFFRTRVIQEIISEATRREYGDW